MSSSLQARFAVSHSDFSLQVEFSLPGEGISALFGPSGSGKTTCLRAMAGLTRPADGFFAVGEEIWQDERQGIFVPPHRRSIGYVFQEASLFSHLSVTGNLQFGVKRLPRGSRAGICWIPPSCWGSAPCWIVCRMSSPVASVSG